MKRFATLALAAIFALSFSASAAAAPEFSGKFTVENEIDLTADTSNVKGDGADLTFTLGAGEEGIWSLEVSLGSALADETATKVAPFETGEGMTYVAVTHAVKIGNTWYYKDADDNYY